MIIDPQEVSTGFLHRYLLGGVAPRPIAFASTIDQEGNVNLSPFSFFNVFSANPPILIFSPARRVRDNTTKHTLENCYALPEVVVNMVDFQMVEQMSLASTEYETGVNEFLKSGLTMVESIDIRPPRVKESPFSMECKVMDIQALGNEGGAGNLIVCEVVKVYVKDEILDDAQQIDPLKLNAVARLGGDWYSKTTKESLFTIPKPLITKGIGFDNIPDWVFDLQYFSKNELARLANIEQFPTDEEKVEWMNSNAFYLDLSKDNRLLEARYSIQRNDINQAWIQLFELYK